MPSRHPGPGSARKYRKEAPRHLYSVRHLAKKLFPDSATLDVRRIVGAGPYPNARFIHGEFRAAQSADERTLLDLSK